MLAVPNGTQGLATHLVLSRGQPFLGEPVYIWHGLLTPAVFVILPWIVDSHSVLDSLLRSFEVPCIIHPTSFSALWDSRETLNSGRRFLRQCSFVSCFSPGTLGLSVCCWSVLTMDCLLLGCAAQRLSVVGVYRQWSACCWGVPTMVCQLLGYADHGLSVLGGVPTRLCFGLENAKALL